jgi:hypothetical protein
MKAGSFAVFALLVLTAASAGAEINLGAGAAYETGNSPLSSLVPQVFVENVYHVGSWETFGVDFFIGSSTAGSASYTQQGYGAGPELFFGTDLSYHFPIVGPAEFAALLGAWGFQDYENRVNGVATQTGLSATVHFGSFFIQGRGLYRFFSTTGASEVPIPLGVYSLVILGGYTIS